jgi:chromosome segregation ATPase
MEATTEQRSIANRELRHLQEMIAALRMELETMRLEKDHAVQQAVTNAHNESQHLRATIDALRDELEKQRFDGREQVQRAQADARNEITQLKSTVTALRRELEDLHHRHSQPGATTGTGNQSAKEPRNAG